MQFSTLTLDWRTRKGGGGKTYRDYLDFIIDGGSLLNHLPPGDQVGVLGWGPATIERSSIAQLLLLESSELQDGRVPLYICPECGGLDCGTVSARIEKTADAFVWSDFAWEVTYSIEPDNDGIIEHYEKVGPFAFRKSEYHNALNGRLEQVAV